MYKTQTQIVPASFAAPFGFVAAAAQAEGEQEDPLLMVATLTVRVLSCWCFLLGG